MKALSTVLCFFLLATGSIAADTPPKPKLKMASDGFPSGHETPEGAACDLARAFIRRDGALFTNACVSAKLYNASDAGKQYAGFLKDKVDSIRSEAAKKEPSSGGPKSIGKVFAARHLTKNGPASYGYAAFEFRDVMFVDVGVFLQSGKPLLNRTLVIKDSDGKWYVHPMPSVSPLLSDGLNDEKPSEKDFREVYEIEK